MQNAKYMGTIKAADVGVSTTGVPGVPLICLPRIHQNISKFRCKVIIIIKSCILTHFFCTNDVSGNWYWNDGDSVDSGWRV